MNPDLMQLALAFAEAIGPELVTLVEAWINHRDPVADLASENLDAILPDPGKARLALALADAKDALAKATPVGTTVAPSASLVAMLAALKAAK